MQQRTEGQASSSSDANTTEAASGGRNKTNRNVLQRILSATALSRSSLLKTKDMDNQERLRLENNAPASGNYVWVWDRSKKSQDLILSDSDTEVYFHPDYSCGTGAVRGKQVIQDGEEHYWEVKMLSAVYGTDMMIGVGTSEIDLDRYKSQFCSIIGRDAESWGLSYFGTLQHNGKTREYTRKFERGTTIGIHLDMWRGTLAFYKNGEPLGVAFEGLQGKELYPMVASTAARTKMKLICSYNTCFSLQYLCCQAISKTMPHTTEAIDQLPVSGPLKDLLKNHLSWIFRINNPTSPGPTAKRFKR